MTAVTICIDFGAQENNSVTVSTVSPSICHEVIVLDVMIFIFWMLSFNLAFSLSSFTFIKWLFSSSLLSDIKVVSSEYLRLLIFLPAILIAACASTWHFAWCSLHVRLNKQHDNMLLLLLSCFSRVLLCNPMDGSPPGSPVPGILQARTLEWVAISFSNAWKWKVKVKSLNHVQLFATPWTAAYQAPVFMWFSRQEYWSGLPLPFPIYSLFTLRSKHLLIHGGSHHLQWFWSSRK